MAIHRLAGHQWARRRMAAALVAGRLPQVILLTGPVGVGKQRLGIWAAQILLCTSPGSEGPCQACRACRQVDGLAHPDFHWFIPIARPKATDPDKQVEEAADLLSEAIAARRAEPWYERPDGMAVHAIASARLLLRRAALTPVQGPRKVFLVGDADRLVPQESSPESANALLKLLEEPPADTWLLLTTTDAERVLPTIRSRAVLLRLTSLSSAEVRDFASEHLRPAPPADELNLLVERAEGAIGALAGSGDRNTRSAVEARAFLAAVRNGPASGYERALKQAPWAARGGFTDLLDAVAVELSNRARGAASGAGGAEELTALTRAQELIRTARGEAQGNVNPQLLMASLALELEDVL